MPGLRYWLTKVAYGRLEVLTFDREGGETLPVFSYEEEAGMFLQFEHPGDG